VTDANTAPHKEEVVTQTYFNTLAVGCNNKLLNALSKEMTITQNIARIISILANILIDK
jgi:hypothetical protein